MTDCLACTMPVADENAPCCEGCLAHFGPVLTKALADPFDYEAILSTGMRVRFTHCTVQDNWVTFCGNNERPCEAAVNIGSLRKPRVTFHRGLCVHLRHIVGVADAPNGS